MKRKVVIELKDNGKTERIICEKKQAKKLTRVIIKNNLLKLKAVS